MGNDESKENLPDPDEVIEPEKSFTMNTTMVAGKGGAGDDKSGKKSGANDSKQ